MAFRSVEAVEVRIWGKTVGAVALDPRLRFYVFEYAPAFVRSGIELAPLTMPLAAAREPFVFPTLPEDTYWRLPGLLADAFPDDFGNALIDAWMAREGVAKASITSLDRLAYMGKRGMGALEFRPARGPRARKSRPPSSWRGWSKAHAERCKARSPRTRSRRRRSPRSFRWAPRRAARAPRRRSRGTRRPMRCAPVSSTSRGFRALAVEARRRRGRPGARRGARLRTDRVRLPLMARAAGITMAPTQAPRKTAARTS